MFEEVKDTDIKEVSTWDSSETTVKYMGYDRVTMLEPTPKNMHMLMLKINELVEEINKLKQINYETHQNGFYERNGKF